MLSHISQAHALMPPDDTFCRLQLTDEELHRGRFSSSIGTDDRNTRGYAHCQGDVLDRVLCMGWVFESDILHLQDSVAS